MRFPDSLKSLFAWWLIRLSSHLDFQGVSHQPCLQSTCQNKHCETAPCRHAGTCREVWRQQQKIPMHLSARIHGIQVWGQAASSIMQRRHDLQTSENQWNLQHYRPTEHLIPSLLQLWFRAWCRMDSDPVSLLSKQWRFQYQSVLPARYANQPRCTWMEQLPPVNVPYEVHPRCLHSLASHL